MPLTILVFILKFSGKSHELVFSERDLIETFFQNLELN